MYRKSIRFKATILSTLLAVVTMFGIETSAQMRKGRADGGGGEGEIRFNFQESAQQALTNMQRLSELRSLPIKELEKKLASVKILVSDDILYIETQGIRQESPAINNSRENTIVISKPLWLEIKSSVKRESVALHELLSLLELEGTGDYRYSQIYYDGFKPTVQIKYKDLMKAKVLNDLEDPKVVITVFEDFSSPWVYLNNKVLQKIIKRFGDKVQIVVRNRPITILHENAEPTALAGICANDQGQFQIVRHKFLQVFEKHSWSEDILNPKHVREILLSIPGLDVKKMDECMKSPAAQMSLEIDLRLGSEFKIYGTPQMIVSAMDEIVAVNGVHPEDYWISLLSKMLSDKK